MADAQNDGIWLDTVTSEVAGSAGAHPDRSGPGRPVGTGPGNGAAPGQRVRIARNARAYGMIELGPTGVIRGFDPAIARLLGRSPNDLIGSHFDTLSAVDVGRPIAAHLRKHVEGRGDSSGSAFRVARSDGTSLVLAITVLSHGKGAQPSGLTVFLSFIEEVESGTPRFLGNGHVRLSPDPLTGRLAHELRDAIQAIGAQVRLLMQRGVTDRGTLEFLLSESDRATATVAELLHAFRTGRDGGGRSDRVDLNDVVADLLRRRAAAHRAAGITSIADLSPDLPSIRTDRSVCEAILLHLLINAEYAVQGRSVRRLIVRTEVAEATVDVTVSDTGPGIPSVLGDRVFEPYWLTKPADAGTGIGLVLARHLADRLDGRLGHLGRSAESGASFRFELPR